MPGIDRYTGRPLEGWPHVVQSIGDIMTTRFGERVRREWYGSDVPQLLGRLANVDTFVLFYSAVARALTIREINGIAREPRFRIVKFQVNEVTRLGEATVVMEGIYLPRALFGDFTPDGARSVTLVADNQRVFAR